MAKIFLDTNFVLDVAYRRPKTRLMIEKHQVFISPLSIHILCYVNKIKIPNKALSRFLKEYVLLPINDNIITNSSKGPTTDLEDNIQLHSASEAECDMFLTNDKKLLNMKFFGKTKIILSI